MQTRREGGRKWNEQSDVGRMIEDGGSERVIVVGETEIGIERGGVALEADRIHDRLAGEEVAGETQRSNFCCSIDSNGS